MNLKRLLYLSGLVLFTVFAVHFLVAHHTHRSGDQTDVSPEAAVSLSSDAEQDIIRPSDTKEALHPDESTDVCRKLDERLDTGRLREALIEARSLMKHSDPEVRKQVAYALDWIGADALPELSSMMNDTDPEVAEIAVSAFWDNLDQLNDAELKSELLELLLQSPDLAIQKRAVDEIGYLPPKQSIPLILGKAPSADPELYLTIQQNLYFLSGGEEFRTLEEWEAWYSTNKDAFESE